VEMIELDITMDNDLITKTRNLAVRYFGDDSDVSLAQVLEVAFKMRSLWSHSVNQGQQETGEAVSAWDFSESTSKEEKNGSIQKWLFRR
jgi:hypothetical protein